LKQSERFEIRISKALLRDLDKEVRLAKKGRAEIVREALRDYLNSKRFSREMEQ
jgi:metal-responsive CopG/Arc/MetJ family transcriptional regulator